MPIRIFKCEKCGEELKTLKKSPDHCGTTMSTVLTAPQVSFVEPRNPDSDHRGKSVMKDQNKILKERAKAFTRDNELDDLVQEHGALSAKTNGWVTEKGVTRKRIDEI